ncbi:MAG: DUF1499 domain-containing protein [Roseovarius sp.]|jgi:hypothetical protein|nr:DUF1499 domain-containing protein [Roseovarius sp.]
MLRRLALVVLALALALGAFIRLAPSDPARWHRMPETITDRNLEGGAMRRVVGDLAALDAIARATPRTRVLAGSVEEGMITYVTRSRVMGFPDYTTVRQAGDMLEIFARLRFGRSDLGVNAARVDDWLRRLADARRQAAIGDPAPGRHFERHGAPGREPLAIHARADRLAHLDDARAPTVGAVTSSHRSAVDGGTRQGRHGRDQAEGQDRLHGDDRGRHHAPGQGREAGQGPCAGLFRAPIDFCARVPSLS